MVMELPSPNLIFLSYDLLTLQMHSAFTVPSYNFVPFISSSVTILCVCVFIFPIYSSVYLNAMVLSILFFLVYIVYRCGGAAVHLAGPQC